MCYSIPHVYKEQHICDDLSIQIGDSVGSAVGKINLNLIAAASKGMQAVKLCSNKILQFLTGVAG